MRLVLLDQEAYKVKQALLVVKVTGAIKATKAT